MNFSFGNKLQNISPAMLLIFSFSLLVWSITNICVQTVNITRNDHDNLLSHLVTKETSYSDLILIKSPSQLHDATVYNLSVTAQIQFRNFLKTAIDCPNHLGHVVNESTCYRAIPHNAFVRVCCDERSKFYRLDTLPFTLNKTHSTSLLQLLTSNVVQETHFGNDDSCSSKRMLILSFYDNIPTSALQIIKYNDRVQLQKFLLISYSCNESLGRITGDARCYRQISHHKFYLCCNENRLPQFLYFHSIMLKLTEIDKLMNVLSDRQIKL